MVPEVVHETARELAVALQPVFAKYAGSLAAVYVFGSVARGESAPASDIDLAVLFVPKDDGSPANGRFALYADLSRALKRNDIDITVLNTAQNLILQEEIVRRGVLIFDGAPEIRSDYEQRILHAGIDFRHQRALVMGM